MKHGKIPYGETLMEQLQNGKPVITLDTGTTNTHMIL